MRFWLKTSIDIIDLSRKLSGARFLIVNKFWVMSSITPEKIVSRGTKPES